MEQDGSSNRGETEHQLKKYREVEFFGLLPPKPIYMGRYPVAGSGPDCKSGALQLGWFESNPAHQGKFGNFSFLSTKNYPPGDGIRNLVVAHKRVIMCAVWGNERASKL